FTPTGDAWPIDDIARWLRTTAARLYPECAANLAALDGNDALDRSDLTPEMDYLRLNPGAGGAASQQQERAKANPKTTRDDGGAAIPGSQNEDLKGRQPKGPLKPPA